VGGDGQKLEQVPMDRSLGVSSRLSRRDWPNDAVPTLTGSTWNIGRGRLEWLTAARLRRERYARKVRAVRASGLGMIVPAMGTRHGCRLPSNSRTDRIWTPVRWRQAPKSSFDLAPSAVAHRRVMRSPGLAQAAQLAPATGPDSPHLDRNCTRARPRP